MCVLVRYVASVVCDRLCVTPWTSPPGSSVHGIFQARVLEWVAMLSSRVVSQPRDQTHISYVSCIGRQVLYLQCHQGSPNTKANARKELHSPSTTIHPNISRDQPHLSPRWVYRAMPFPPPSPWAPWTESQHEFRGLDQHQDKCDEAMIRLIWCLNTIELLSIQWRRCFRVLLGKWQPHLLKTDDFGKHPVNPTYVSDKGPAQWPVL